MVAHLDASDRQNSEAKIKTILYLNELWCKSFKFWKETLLEQKYPTVMRKLGLKNIINDRKISVFRSVQILIQKPADRNLNRSCYLKIKVATFDPMKVIKPVLTEKHFFDKRYESVLITTFWKIWTIKKLMQGTKSEVFSPSPLQKQWSFQLRILWKKLGLQLHRIMMLIFDKCQQNEKNWFWSVSGFRCKETKWI